MLREKIVPNLEPFENQLTDFEVDGQFLPLKKVVETEFQSNIDIVYGSVVDIIEITMELDKMVLKDGSKEISKEFLTL